MGVIKKLAGSVREYKKPAIITVILMVFEVLIEVAMPFVVAGIINSIQAKNGVDINRVLLMGGLLIIMAFLSLTCGGLGGYTCAKASSGFSKNLRKDIFEKIQDFSFENIDKFSSASLVTRLTTDASNVQMSFMMLIRTAIRSPLMFIFATVMSFVLGGPLAATFVVVVPVLVLGLLMISKKAMPAFRRVFKKYDKLNESIEENVRGMRVVKGFSREDYEKEKFGKASENIRIDFTKAERIIALNTPLMQFCMYFNMIFILWVGAYFSINSMFGVNIGHISAMLNYGMQILMSLMMLSMIYVMLTMSAESARRICEVLDEKSTLTNPENAKTEVCDGSICFDGVSFKYSKEAQRFALENINVDIKSGMTVGIIGGTGSSKSTLVQLIPRLYDVTEGSVKVGGVDVREYDIKSLRDSVAMVLQKNLLFAGTINENLRWGNENATQEEIVEACKLAQAHDFVMSFPEGYETHIEQGGTNVSGGQKQRLCIARALLKRPKVLILDDSTSAVDTKTDAFIREGFKSYIPETTKIIIAQRISSVQDADLIIVMDNGYISAMGKHEELLVKSNIYKEVYEQQVGGAKDEE